MKTTSQLFLILTLLSTSVLANGYKGLEDLNFTDAQVEKHQQNIEEFQEIGKECLQEYRRSHLEFYNGHCKKVTTGFFRRRTYTVCLSKYYGDRKWSKKRFQRRADGWFLKYIGDELEDYGFPLELMDEMESISCVGMAMKCLEKSFVRTGQREAWNTVNRFTVQNGTGGTALQEALRRLGWKILYWNPMPENQIMEAAEKWDNQEKDWQSKGWHGYRFQNILKNSTYWFNKVDDYKTLVGFYKSVPELLYQVPFWIGTAHTGYHVFPGTFQEVVEAHSTRELTSKDNLEFSEFNPLNGEGPKWTATEKYRSGLIAVPPGHL